MNLLRAIPFYFIWHYTTAIEEGFGVFKNFVWFLFRLFSISLLFKTLFTKFHRLGEDYQKGFDISGLFSTFVINAIMRVVGFLIRIFVIVFGLISIALLFVLGIVSFFVWLALPLIILTLIVDGLVRIF